MTNNTETLQTVTKARRDVAAERVCLRCGATFQSEGFGERICRHCKSSSLWRSSVPFSDGQGWRRSSGQVR